MKRTIFIFVFILFVGMLFSAKLQVNITQNFFNVFLPSYFDTNIENKPIIFSGLISSDIDIENYEIEILLSWNGKTLIGENDLVAKGKIPLKAGEGFSFNNKEIFVNGENLKFSADFSMDIIEDNNSEFEDLMLKTGRFPDGEYVFRFILKNIDNNEQIASEEGQFIIINPFSIRLLYPLSLGTNTIGEVNSSNPTFLWTSNLSSYNFYLYDVNSSNIGLEQIKNMEPIYQENNIIYPSLIYPSSAIRLREGTIYAWRVEGDILSPVYGDNNIMESDVSFFEFRKNSQNNFQTEQLLSLLSMISDEKLEELISLLDEGYMFTGECEIDGAVIDSRELYKVFTQLINGSKKIENVEIQ